MTSPAPTRLYAITPPRIDLRAFIPQVEQAFAGGDIACLQLRLKDCSDSEIIEAGKALAPICQKHNVVFLINDRADLIKASQAQGVHLGQEDLENINLKTLRRQLGEEMVIGITCHASRHLAMEAGEAGADYVAFGAFYPTISKPKEKLEKWGTPDVELLEAWSAFSTLPSVAIGGITPQNLGPLVKAGADFLAVITGIWDHPQGPWAAVTEYNKATAEALSDNSAPSIHRCT